MRVPVAMLLVPIAAAARPEPPAADLPVSLVFEVAPDLKNAEAWLTARLSHDLPGPLAVRLVFDQRASGASLERAIAVPPKGGVALSLALPVGDAPGRHDWTVGVWTAPGETAPPALGNPAFRTKLRLAVAPRWSLIGPFADAAGRGFDEAFPPEKGFDPNASVPGAGGQPVSWKPLDPAAVAPDGLVDLARVFPGTNDAVVYARGLFHAEKAVPVRLRLGSDDSLKVFLNGALVHSKNARRTATRGEDEVRVELRAGANDVLLKVGQRDGGWGYYFEFDDGVGRAPSGVRFDTGVFRSSLLDPRARVTSVGRDGASIVWESEAPARGRVSVTKARPGRSNPRDGITDRDAMLRTHGPTRAVDGDLVTTEHEVRVSGLQPGTRYVVRPEPGAGSGPLPRLCFVTAPPAGKTSVVHLRLAALLFTNVVERSSAARPGAKEPLPPADVARIREELQRTVFFYFVNSGARLALDLTLFEDDDPHESEDDAPYGFAFAGKEFEILDRLLSKKKQTAADFDGVLFVSCDKRFADGSWRFPASGGGTYGPLPPTNAGKSGWKGGSDNAWLFCHEFGHQLDALFHESGYDEFLFNHPQPWDGTANRTGEHWDCNAWLLREWGGFVSKKDPGGARPTAKGYRWSFLRWGETRLHADADEDGVPDAAPELPFDEARLGGDPGKPDTDGDGLSDLAEVMAANGVELGLGELWAGPPPARRGDPKKPDTDGDGAPDGTDPAPLYPWPAEVPPAKGTMDGAITEGEYRWRARMEDASWSGDLSLAWTERFLQIGLSGARAPDEVKLLFDLDDDGWYAGPDNLHLVVRPDGKVGGGDAYYRHEAGTIAATIVNASVEGKWPFEDRSALRDGTFRFVQQKEGDVWSCEVAIEGDRIPGLRLRDGEPMGVLWGVGVPGGSPRPGKAGMLTLFEPHTFLRLRLAGTPAR